MLAWILSILYILHTLVLIFAVMLLIGTIIHLIKMIKKLKDDTLKAVLCISILANILWIIDIIVQIITQ